MIKALGFRLTWLPRADAGLREERPIFAEAGLPAHRPSVAVLLNSVLQGLSHGCHGAASGRRGCCEPRGGAPAQGRGAGCAPLPVGPWRQRPVYARDSRRLRVHSVLRLFSRQSLAAFAWVLATVPATVRRGEGTGLSSEKVDSRQWRHTGAAACTSHMLRAQSECGRWLRGPRSPRSCSGRRPAFIRWAAGRDRLGRACCLPGRVLGARCVQTAESEVPRGPGRRSGARLLDTPDSVGGRDSRAQGVGDPERLQEG